MMAIWPLARHRSSDVIAVQLSRGAVVMSQASLDALGPDVLARMCGDVDIISAEDALAELDAEEKPCS